MQQHFALGLEFRETQVKHKRKENRSFFNMPIYNHTIKNFFSHLFNIIYLIIFGLETILNHRERVLSTTSLENLKVPKLNLRYYKTYFLNGN